MLPSRNAGMCRDNNAEVYPIKSALLFPDKSAKMFPDKNAAMFPESSARMFPGSSVPMCPAKNAKTFLDSSAAMFLSSSAPMFLGNSAAMCPDSSASRCPGNSAQLHCPNMEVGGECSSNRDDSHRCHAFLSLGSRSVSMQRLPHFVIPVLLVSWAAYTCITTHDWVMLSKWMRGPALQPNTNPVKKALIFMRSSGLTIYAYFYQNIGIMNQVAFWK